MNNRWLFIVTRLSASKGDEDWDEFVMKKLWGGQDTDEPLRYSVEDRCLSVFHGYLGAFPDLNQRAEALTKLIESELANSRAPNDSLLGVLIHGDLAAWPNLGEVLKMNGKTAEQGLDPGALGTGQLGYELYEELAKHTVAQDQTGFCNAFDSLWDRFAGERGLEAKLELLHLCLTPAGAGKLASEIDNPYPEVRTDEWDKVKGIAEQLQKKKPFQKDYVTALTDLRTKLLEKEKTMASAGADN